MLIGPTEIAALLPHTGAMCLIESVETCDPDQIVCLTATHRLATNPLRRLDRLGIMAGVEYASQAMALHAALQAQGPATKGYLASLRAVTLHRDRLDPIPGSLTIKAGCQHREAARAVYGFTLTAAEGLLMEGRAVVIFMT
jgi:predicted hotdog family 3-hydroxylacyl-ACP dehydratase